MLSYGTCRFQLQGTGQLLLSFYYSLGKLTQLRWSSLKLVSTVSLAAFTFASATHSFLANIPTITKGAGLIIGLDCPTCIQEESSELSNVLDFWQLRESQWLSCSLHIIEKVNTGQSPTLKNTVPQPFTHGPNFDDCFAHILCIYNYSHPGLTYLPKNIIIVSLY